MRPDYSRPCQWCSSRCLFIYFVLWSIKFSQRQKIIDSPLVSLSFIQLFTALNLYRWNIKLNTSVSINVTDTILVTFDAIYNNNMVPTLSLTPWKVLDFSLQSSRPGKVLEFHNWVWKKLKISSEVLRFKLTGITLSRASDA